MTNEEKIQAIEDKLSRMTPDERAAYIRNEQRSDRNICHNLSQELQAQIEIIEGDLHHLRVNGDILGYNEFNSWMRSRKRQLREEQRRPRVPLLNGGWFN